MSQLYRNHLEALSAATTPAQCAMAVTVGCGRQSIKRLQAHNQAAHLSTAVTSCVGPSVKASVNASVSQLHNYHAPYLNIMCPLGGKPQLFPEGGNNHWNYIESECY